jgi:hypothetical protein
MIAPNDTQLLTRDRSRRSQEGRSEVATVFATEPNSGSEGYAVAKTGDRLWQYQEGRSAGAHNEARLREQADYE